MQKYFKEPFPAISHFFGILLSIAGLVILIIASGNNQEALFASIVYGSSLILLFLASTLTHGLHCEEHVACHFEKCDYAAIFLLIAGTYTPICLFVIKGFQGWLMLGIEWSLALIGVYSVFKGSKRSKASQVIIYLAMGWLFLFAIEPISMNLSNNLLSWLIGGGIFYTVGAIIFLINHPPIWKGHLSAHDIWHLMVLGGSACHFILINYCIRDLST